MTCKMTRGLMTYDDDDELERREKGTLCAMPLRKTQDFINF